MTPRTTQPAQTLPGDCVLLARQPVFDRHERVVGFELSLTADTSPVAGAAAASVVSTAFGDVGLRRIVGDRRAYIDASPQLVQQAAALGLPPERVVLQLDADAVDTRLLQTAGGLTRDGFDLGVGGWALAPEFAPLLELARVIKVKFDFGTLDLARLAPRRAELQARGVTLIATGLETRGEYEECHRLGFDGFQGGYLAEPSGVPGRRTPTFRLAALAALLDATGPGAFEDIERLICQDAGLAHRFLRLADSAFYTARDRVRSVREALLRLGAGPVRRWALLLLLAGLTDSSSPTDRHLLGVGLHRARLCELLVREDTAACPDRAFTAGLLSILPALLHQPLEPLLDELPVDERLSAALIGHHGPEGVLLAAALDYERGERADPGGHPSLLAAISRIYAEALLWSDDTVRQLD
ncbi:MAG TPA: HDOD domain-containing protein [Solirubrobacteraceae bacterium]